MLKMNLRDGHKYPHLLATQIGDDQKGELVLSPTNRVEFTKKQLAELLSWINACDAKDPTCELRWMTTAPEEEDWGEFAGFAMVSKGTYPDGEYDVAKLKTLGFMWNPGVVARD